MRGLSLIELLISLTIGLILMVAIGSAYLGSAGAGRMAEAQSRMNEDAQAALSLLAQQLRMAGNNPKQPNYTSASPRNPVFDSTTFILRGCDGTFTGIATGAISTLNTCPNNATAPDSVAVAYEADIYNTVKTSANVPSDCLGNALPLVNASVTTWTGVGTATTAVTTYVADNRYYISSGSTGTPSLYCKGNGGSTAQPLVENIENLQLRYGTAPTSTTTMVVAGYLTAAGIASDANLAALADDAARWAKVLTVRVCVIARSENQVVPDASSAQYLDCDGTLVTTPPDLRLRRAYSTTVVLRNRMTP
jgi:type IV pilus assembly protein PilW